jgi:hypothetical protein
MNILSGVSLLSKYIFLIQFLFKTDEYPLWGLSLFEEELERPSYLVVFICTSQGIKQISKE